MSIVSTYTFLCFYFNINYEFNKVSNCLADVKYTKYIKTKIIKEYNNVNKAY